MSWGNGPISDGTGKLVNFDTWGDLIDYVKQPHPPDVYQQHSNEYGKNWAGTNTLDEAIDIAVKGWEDGIKDARPIADALIDKLTDMVEVPVIHYDVEGIDFDMARVNRGEPECWYRFEETLQDDMNSAVVSIVVNGAATCTVDAKVIIRRGAVIVALIELLEFAGRKVSVTYEWTCHSDITFRTTVKTPSQPLDLSRLMFACAHPSMLRRLMFKALEMNPREHRAVGSGYSTPTESNEKDRGNIYFKKMHTPEHEKWNKNPEKFILEQLKAQGVHIKES